MPQAYIRPLQILKASAGSGKTFSLTVRFLALLFSGKDKYRKIMAVTFTNKATAEMKHRILSVLAQLAAGGENKDAAAYLEEIQKILPHLSKETIQQQADFIYRQILHDYSRLTITTIDKFVQQIIRSFTFELGIDADYQVTLNLRQVAQDLSELLHHSLDKRPELLRWIIERAQYQIDAGRRWDYQQALQQLSFQIFSEDFQDFDEGIKGEKEGDRLFQDMQQQLEAIKDAFEQPLQRYFEQAARILSDSRPDPGTLKGKSRSPLMQFNKDFPAFLSYLLKDNSPSIGKLADQPDNWFNKQAAGTDPYLYEQLNPLIKSMLGLLDSDRGAYRLALALEDNLYYLRLMKEMSRLLKDYRAANRLLLISDATFLLEGITKGLEDNPSFIWEKTGNRYQHFLFDEFQDTSRKQWQNFRPLVRNALGSAPGTAVAHLIVGDVKQSIYRWRGGDWNLLLREAEQDLGSSFVETQSLQVNYRSDAQIIAFNNGVFSLMTTWLQGRINEVAAAEGTSFYENYWQRQGYDSIIQAAYQDVAQETPEGNPEHTGIVDWKVFPVENNKHRPSQIKDAILKDTADRLYRWIVTEERYRPEQIGILVRENKEAQLLLSYLKEDLQQRGTPDAYQIISGDALNLKAHPAVQLIIQTLWLLIQPEQNRKTYQSICVYLYHTVHQQANNGAVLSTDDWIKVGNRNVRALSEYLPRKICQQTGQLKRLPPAELLETIITEYHLDSNEAALPYLFALRDCMAQFEDRNHTGISGFLEWWEAEGDVFLPSSDHSGAIQMMTVHKAKGLAFDVVVLPFLFWEFGGRGDQLWVDLEETPFKALRKAPLKYTGDLAQSMVKDQYYKEQLYRYMDALNTLYVAMTRPKKHLFLCLPGYSEGKGMPNTVMAGDALHAALEQYELINQKPFIFPEQDEEAVLKEAEKSDEDGWAFHRYPVTHHLQRQLDATTSHQLQRLDNEEHIRIGAAVHRLLATCHSPEGIEQELNKLAQEGWCSDGERPKIHATALQVLTNESLQQLLSREGYFLNERDVIDRDGNSYRPDKVLVGASETIIIDYKFTAKEQEEHKAQVQRYKELFSEMGYPRVSGWLFYGFKEKLVAVN